MPRFRTELKYIIHQSVREMLLSHWGRYLVKAPFTNEYAVGPILSQYFDSPTLHFYNEKLAGIDMRQKVRLRTYGTEIRTGQTAFLEIKCRSFDKVHKYRCRVPEPCDRYLDPLNWTVEDPAMRGAIQGLLGRYDLRPSAQVFYLREAYQAAVESDLRVTFDTSVIAMHPGEKATLKMTFDRSRSLLSDTLAIFEVKSTSELPGWVNEGIVRFELEQRTVPKYVAAVELLGLTEMRGSGEYS